MWDRDGPLAAGLLVVLLVEGVVVVVGLFASRWILKASLKRGR